MSQGAYGIIGVVVGSLLGTVSTILLDRYNRSKQLYLEVRMAKFNYPTGQYHEEPLLGNLSLYIYNDSSLPKTFSFEKFILENSELMFTVQNKKERELANSTVHQIQPNNGIKLTYSVSIHPDVDIKIPDIDNTNAILWYTAGKRSFKLTVPLSYYDVV